MRQLNPNPGKSLGRQTIKFSKFRHRPAVIFPGGDHVGRSAQAGAPGRHKIDAPAGVLHLHWSGGDSAIVELPRDYGLQMHDLSW